MSNRPAIISSLNVPIPSPSGQSAMPERPADPRDRGPPIRQMGWSLGRVSLIEMTSMAFKESGDGKVLPSQLSGKRVDLGLALCGQSGMVRPVPFEKRAGVRCHAPTISRLPWLQLRYQCRHAACDVPVYHVELPLCLAARFLHARKPSAQFKRQGHRVPLPCQPTKLDGPA